MNEPETSGMGARNLIQRHWSGTERGIQSWRTIALITRYWYCNDLSLSLPSPGGLWAPRGQRLGLLTSLNPKHPRTGPGTQYMLNKC